MANYDEQFEKEIDEVLDMLDKHKKVSTEFIKEEYPFEITFTTFTMPDEDEIEWVKEYPDKEPYDYETIVKHARQSVIEHQREKQRKKEEYEKEAEYYKNLTNKEEVYDEDDPFKDIIHIIPTPPKEETKTYEQDSDVFDAIEEIFSGKYTKKAKQEQKETPQDKEWDQLFGNIEFTKGTPPINSSYYEKPKTKFISKIAEFIEDKILEPMGRFFDVNSPEERLVKILIVCGIVGIITVSALEKSVMKQEAKIKEDKSKPKYEQTTDTKVYNTPTTFTQDNNGNITNNMGEEMYKDFVIYAKENNIVMNGENFEEFCNTYYNDTNSQSIKR